MTAGHKFKNWVAQNYFCHGLIS